MNSLKEKAATFFRTCQDDICAGLEHIDGEARFRIDSWERTDSGGGYGGGGDTRILQSGGVFEQAGVNFSEVHGTLPPEMGKKLLDREEELPFFATGVSLVIHPESPLVPTTHANFRYLEVADQCWFGGGADLTPYYLYEEDAIHFHSVIRSACEKHSAEYYPRFKKWCDEYFYLPHRGEARGIGGYFFDYLGKHEQSSLPRYFDFVQTAGASFLETYLPIVERRCDEPWGPEERSFQLMRRGRYVEFNLLYDRGTLFGLKTGGRTESILMSLPPVVHWAYDWTEEPGSREAALLEVLRSPREWV